MLYKFFDLVIESGIELPDLDEVSTGNRALSLQLTQREIKMPANLIWQDIYRPSSENQRSATVAWSLARNAQDLFLRIPGCGDLHVENSLQSATCHPYPQTSESALRSQFTYNVIPRILGELGYLIVHSSCVQAGSTGGIVFLGPSGVGKSTLAASFACDGAKFVSDDSVLLKTLGGRVVALVSSSCARLWDDSLNVLLGENHDAVLYARTPRGMKWKHRFDQDELMTDPVPVCAIIEISRPVSSTRCDEIILTPKTGAERLYSLIDGTLLFDSLNSQTRTRRFLNSSQVADACTNFFTISYPRDYKLLPKVRKAILERVTEDSVANHARIAI